jgi:hypothetical protein
MCYGYSHVVHITCNVYRKRVPKMFETVPTIFHAVLVQIGTAFALIALALGGLAWMRANGK